MQKSSNRSPYVLVCFQECERMNILLREIRVSLQRLDLGLKVSLKVVVAPVSARQRTLTTWSLFSMQGGADVVSWDGSPAVPAELWHSPRHLEQTGLSIYIRPGPVVSCPSRLPLAVIRLGAGSVLSHCCVRTAMTSVLCEYTWPVTVRSTASFTWVSSVCGFKGKTQWS